MSIYEIREHRNNAIGHPTSRRNDKSFHLIGRVSISKKGFTLASYYPKTGEKSKFEEINILNCIQVQTTLVDKILKETMDKVQADFENHKSRFKGQKLTDLIHDDFHYEFSKLYENIGCEYPLVEINFNTICKAYAKIKNGIIERYFSLEALPGISYTVGILDYIFGRLERDFIKNKIEDQIELTIFVDALKSNFVELQEMLKEIDREFE